MLVTALELLDRMRWFPFSTILMTAADKVRGALPRGGQADLDRLRADLSFVGVPARTADSDVLRQLETAWFEDRPVDIDYNGASGVSVRTVRIRQIVMERTEVLLNCDDLQLGESRQFKLHQVIRAVVSDDS